MKLTAIITVLACAVVTVCGARPAPADGVVHARFFHTDCDECRRVKLVLERLSEEHGTALVIHNYDFSVPSNYLLMVQLEQALGVRENQPVAVYVGTNYLYGVGAITERLGELVRAGRAAGGVGLWEPGCAAEEGAAPANAAPEDAVVKRYRTFSLGVILSAGLLDGINPCAFATLVLFVTMLSCYKATWREVISCTLVFAAAVFATYFALGAGLAETVRVVQRARGLAAALHWGMVALCVVFAVVSIRDAWRIHRSGRAEEAVLGLPASWREKIARLLGAHVGRKRWLAGVFGVGVIVSLLESICTGQVYVPTLTYMVRTTPERWQALSMLAAYNAMFVMPLLGLGGALALGVRSQRIVEWQKKHAVPARVIMAGLFGALALVLVLTGK